MTPLNPPVRLGRCWPLSCYRSGPGSVVGEWEEEEQQDIALMGCFRDSDLQPFRNQVQQTVALCTPCMWCSLVFDALKDSYPFTCK